MNNDDKIRKQMEFILNQQAQFAADMGQLQEKHGQLQEAHRQLENIVGRLATTTLEGFEGLVDAQIRTEENISTLTERVTALAEAQTHTDERLRDTDERLNTLINVVERHISEGRNGGPQS
jgi:ABC-type transporter Mla subunit MlaD